MFYKGILRHDREERIVDGVQHLSKEKYHRILGKGRDQEYIVNIWGRGQKIVVTHYYNPCKKKMELDKLKEVQGQDIHIIIWCGYLNENNTLRK